MSSFTNSILNYPAGANTAIRRVKVDRAPTTTDYKNFIPGDEWLNTASSDWWKFVGNFPTNGGALWLRIGANTESFPITPYVVGPAGQAGYQTIQSAINAANAAGGGVVYIQPGTYQENLTLYDKVDLYGTPAVSQNQGSSVSIQGTHTPPLSGHIGFNSICFLAPGTTNAFDSSATGSTHLVFLNCESAVQNGYFLNLPNWTGILEFFDINPATVGAPYSVNDGGINNTGGATLFLFGAAIGSGTNVMTLSGSTICGQGSINCPINFVTGSNISMQNMQFFGEVTFSNNAQGSLDTCNFYGGVSSAITMSSSQNIEISCSTIQCNNNPAISGSGSGTLLLTNISFLGNSNISNAITLGSGSLFPVNMTNGQLLIGSTGQPAVSANLTSTGGTINITNGAGSINLEANNSGVQWVVETTDQTLKDSNGYFANAVGNLNFTLPLTSNVGDTYEVVNMNTGGFTIIQNANQQIRLGTSTTTLGVGGSLASTAQGDWIQLTCSVANLNWIAAPKQGNFTVV